MKKILYRIVTYILLIVFSLIFLFPVYMMTVYATKNVHEDYRESSPIVYGTLFVDNFLRLIQASLFLRSIFNSAMIAILSATASIVCCTIAGFFFAKIKFKFRNLLFGLVIATMMVPTFVKLIPLYHMMIAVKWINTYLPFIFIAMTSPLGIFLMKQYIEFGLPDELMDAGKIDGMNQIQFIFFVVFPVQRAAIAVLGTLIFIGTWNDYMTALVMLSIKEAFTIPIFLQSALYNTISSGTYSELMTANLFTQLPILIVFLIASKQIIKNIVAGSIK
ncbi:MAG: carbohydrate ABC transporter permease [Spirochaetales bacterium]|nr:carbohydrate ABC transporter permease [Spirochaetales bacterium]